MGRQQPHVLEPLKVPASQDSDLKNNTLLFSPNYGDVMERKASIKDLGILLDEGMKYTNQPAVSVAKANKKASWALHTFRCRDRKVMKTIWKSCLSLSSG